MTRGIVSVARAVRVLGGLALASSTAACVSERSDFDTTVWRLNARGAPHLQFGDSGRVIVHLSDFDERASDVVVAPDGTLTLVGLARDSSGSAATAVRLTAGGALDSTFARSGVLRLDPGRAGEAAAVALQGRRVIVGGWTQPQPARFGAFITRVLPEGVVDTSFGSAGFAVLPAEQFKDVADLSVSPDGKIWAVGRRGEQGYVLRLDADGNLDPSFGQGGSSTLDWRVRLAEGPQVIRFQADGTAIVAGESDEGWRVVRLSGAGVPDPSFGEGGTVSIDWRELNQRVSAVLVRPDRRFLLVGSTDRGVSLASLLPDGSPDPSFGQNGRVVFALGEYDSYGVDAVNLPTGELLVLAENSSHKGSRPFLLRVAADGRSYQPEDPARMAELRSDGPLDFVHASRMVESPHGGIFVIGQM